ncbi:unnamed protein product [Somion occarium]|uniref:DUF6534 domain-containing protein n=1 Tax=Somion occarium TaxID=3059160 RepID=A0ABP1CEG5_9APHY
MSPSFLADTIRNLYMSELNTSIGELLGSYVISSCITFIVYGIGVTQSYVYFLNCGKDPKWLKLLVGGVTLLETVHTVMVIHILYRFTVTGFGNLEVVGSISWSPPTAVIVENLIIVLVEGFFIYRLWILSKRSMSLVVTISSLHIVRCAFGITVGSLAFTHSDWVSYRSTTSTVVIVNVTDCLALLEDGVIAGFLIHYLRSSRKGFNPRTDRVILWLMSYIINTGLITMIVSLCVMVTFIAVEENFIFLGLNLIVCKLYANSLFGTLNARQMLHARVIKSLDPESDISRLSEIVASSQRIRTASVKPIRIQRSRIIDSESSLELQTGKEPVPII